MHLFKQFLFILFLVSIISSCSTSEKGKEEQADTTKQTSQLGDIDFKVTGAEIAQADFEKALLLLHSFEYEDSREVFLNVQELDSTFAMAYWGEAMTYHHALWQRQDQEKALAALNKLAPDAAARLALVKTEIERDFFKAAEILFGEGTKYDRDVAYSEFMGELSKKYPKSHEVAAFHAISLLGASRNGRNDELYDKSARIVQGIIKENPEHPGALHYLIHSYDDPTHAHLAKAAADNYAVVAPDAAHALHMPSHIYVALGLWDDVVTSNIASWNASVKRMERKQLESGKSYHAYNWLQYGFLQRGELDKAGALLDKMVDYAATEPTGRARSYLLAMKGAQLVETEDWKGAQADIEVKVEDLNIVDRAGYAYLEGMKAAANKDASALTTIIATMEEERMSAMNLVGDKGFAMCSAGGFASRPPNQLDIDMANVLEMELRAVHSTLKEDYASAKKWYEDAIILDESLSYSFGPPSVFKPAQEAYGEWLLVQNEPKEALVIFEKALKRHPRRLRSLKGKKQAAELVKSAEDVAAAEQELAASTEKKEWKEIL